MFVDSNGGNSQNVAIEAYALIGVAVLVGNSARITVDATSPAFILYEFDPVFVKIVVA